jgi:quinol---cytochrome c reductase iron-sulfur subunit, bacillus type
LAEHDDVENGEETSSEHGSPGGPPQLPPPSIYPFGFAAGLAVLLVGLVINWWIVAVGAGIAVVFGFLWARDATAGYRRKPVPPLPVAAEKPEAEEEPEEGPERFARDKFLERSTLALGGFIGAAITIPVVGFAVAPAFIDQDDEDVDLGPLENFPENEYIVTTFEGHPLEGEVSRQTAFVRNNGIANGVPSFTIISNHCVHLGCPTQPNGPTDFDGATQIDTDTGPVTFIKTQPAGFGCPCHGGQYDNEGNRTAGPPVRSLDRYRYSIVNGNLVLGARYSVGKVVGTGADAQIEAYDRYYPGDHVDGGEQVFYPWPGT